MTRIKQDQKLVVKRVKVMWDYTSINIHWAFSSKKLFKKLPTYMWPMFTHVWPISIHVELIINYELIMSELKIN
jgi:hypothetical protein